MKDPVRISSDAGGVFISGKPFRASPAHIARVRAMRLRGSDLLPAQERSPPSRCCTTAGVCHADLVGNSGERARLQRICCHRELSQIVGRYRSFRTTRRSGLAVRDGSAAFAAFGYPQQIHRRSDSKFTSLLCCLLHADPHYSQPSIHPASAQIRSGGSAAGCKREREVSKRGRLVKQTPFVLPERTGDALFRKVTLLR